MFVNKFVKGIGCYRCVICSKRTRSTGRGNEIVRMCRRCFMSVKVPPL